MPQQAVVDVGDEKREKNWDSGRGFPPAVVKGDRMRTEEGETKERNAPYGKSTWPTSDTAIGGTGDSKGNGGG